MRIEVGRIEGFALTVMSLPARGLAWVTGWSTGEVATDLSRLHAVLLPLIVWHDHALFGNRWLWVSILGLIGWVVDDLWTDARSFRVLDEWRAGHDDAIPQRVLSTWLYLRRWFLIIGACWLGAVVAQPTGWGELVWALKPMAYAGALYGGGPGTSVTARARGWLSARAPRLGWSPG